MAIDVQTSKGRGIGTKSIADCLWDSNHSVFADDREYNVVNDFEDDI